MAKATSPLPPSAQAGNLTALMDDPIVTEAIEAIEGLHEANENKSFADDDPRIAAARTHFDAVALRTWVREPTTLADVVARAILSEALSGAVDEWSGAILDLDPEETAANSRPPVCDLAAAAHLFDAIRKVLGGRRYPREGVAVPGNTSGRLATAHL